jgi:SAM-dependent methyltransferase
LSNSLRGLLGLRRRFEIDGVTYTERSREPLRRALSRRGRGYKEYDARFRDGSTLPIRCTPIRVYADLLGPVLLPCYQVAENFIRPGMRVLDASCGTGYGSAWLLDRVGPSGAVVAITRDEESARYAQARYRAPNIAFERGWTDAVAGEVDGAFDAVVACNALTPGDDARRSVTEWMRVIALGGWMLIVQPAPAPHEAPPRDTPPNDDPAPLPMSPAQLRAVIEDVCGSSFRDPANPKPDASSEAAPAADPPAIRVQPSRELEQSVTAAFTAVLVGKSPQDPTNP